MPVSVVPMGTAKTANSWKKPEKETAGTMHVSYNPNRNLLSQQLDCYSSKNVDCPTEDLTLFVIRTKAMSSHSLRSSCTASRHPRVLVVHTSRESVPEVKSSSGTLSPETVSLSGQVQSCQALSACQQASVIHSEGGQEQIVPCAAMDYDPYYGPESPEHLHEFKRPCDFNVASSRNNTFLWPQQHYREANWSETFQPSASSQSYFDDSNNSSFSTFEVQQQQRPTNSFIDESDVTFLENSSFNLPELNDLIDCGNASDSINPPSVNGGYQPSPSVSNVSDSLLVDPNLVLNESSLDVAELDQYLNTPEKSGNSPESLFSSIIHEDQYENLVAVQLDHAYDAPSTSNHPDSVDLDISILDEFFTPIDQESLKMGRRSEIELAVSPSYNETFTNLEPYLNSDSNRVSPRHDECGYIAPASEEPFGGALDSICSGSSNLIGKSYKETAEYRAKRDKNNISSQKSRLKRQNKFKMLKEEEIKLKRRNTELAARVSSLERQVQDIKDIIMKAITA